MPEHEPRPSWACQLHRPPTDGQPWMKADGGYTTCDGCLNRLRSTLRDIGTGYARLAATPGGSGDHGGRGAPGFRSTPAANLNVVAMRDPRSLPYETKMDLTVYVWDPLADLTLEPGQHGPPAGAYVEKREVWLGQDGRTHTEQARAVLSVPGALAGICRGIADMRDLTYPRGGVDTLTRWLDNQLDWLTRQDWVAEPAAELRRLAAQIRGVHEPRRRIGPCPNTIDEGDHTRVCGAPLYAPVRDDTIWCHAPGCGRRWPRDKWLDLGQIMQRSA